MERKKKWKPKQNFDSGQKDEINGDEIIQISWCLLRRKIIGTMKQYIVNDAISCFVYGRKYSVWWQFHSETLMKQHWILT